MLKRREEIVKFLNGLTVTELQFAIDIAIDLVVSTVRRTEKHLAMIENQNHDLADKIQDARHTRALLLKEYKVAEAELAEVEEMIQSDYHGY